SDLAGRGDRAARALVRAGEGGPAGRAGGPRRGALGGTREPGRDAAGGRGGAAAPRRGPSRRRTSRPPCAAGRRFTPPPAGRRWQDGPPSTRGEGPGFVAPVLEQLQGLALPVRLWEDEVLPRRVQNYRPAWLDEVLGGGAWLWRAGSGGRNDCRQDGLPQQLRIAFFLRDSLVQPEGEQEPGERTADEARALDLLEKNGASFVTELARVAALERSRVRRALVELTARGLVTNDRFDPMRPGADSTRLALTEAASDRRHRGGHSLRMRPRRPIAGQAEGRW